MNEIRFFNQVEEPETPPEGEGEGEGAGEKGTEGVSEE